MNLKEKTNLINQTKLKMMDARQLHINVSRKYSAHSVQAAAALRYLNNIVDELSDLENMQVECSYVADARRGSMMRRG